MGGGTYEKDIFDNIGIFVQRFYGISSKHYWKRRKRKERYLSGCGKSRKHGHGIQTFTGFVCDSAKFNNFKRGYDKKAVAIPKYDEFSEKMKNDDWLGGLLKNILFR